jgi:hypothetical protein
MSDTEFHHRAVECILEDESLTADLTDEAAKVLLDWGLAQAEAMAQQADLNARLANLRRTMKRINEQAGEAAPDDQVERVQMLLAQLEQAQDREVEAGA